ncbi:MAG: GNAT family N-acetyltransferase [Granulosicoccus sp.]
MTNDIEVRVDRRQRGATGQAEAPLKPLSRSEPLTIDCLNSPAALEQLQGVWQTLEQQDFHCTPFNTWLWNHLWWRHYASRSDTLAILVVRSGKRVVAIAPLFIHATHMLKILPVRVLRFIGTGGDTSPDYLNIICLPTWRDAAEKAVLEFLPHIHGWHKLIMSDVAANTSLASRVTAFVDEQPGVPLSLLRHTIQKASLPTSYDAYRAQLSRKRRKQINHRQNRLSKAGLAELSVCTTQAELNEATDALVALHRLRWKSKNEAGAFRSAAYEQFHRAVISEFFAADALWLATLRLDGQIIGVQYIFAWRGTLMFMQSGYSPEHEKLSAGHVLFNYVIQRGIEQGMTGVDMLKGHYDYKSVYARDEIQTIDSGLVRPGLRGVLAGLHNRMAMQLLRQ